MPDLLESINAFFPPTLSGHLAARLGESGNATRRALQAGVPVVLSGLIGKLGTGDAAFAFQLSQSVGELRQENLASVTEILVVLGSRNAPGSLMTQGEAMLTALFGRSEQLVVSSLSQYAGITPASARTLLELVSGVLPAVLQQFMVRNQLTNDAATAALLKVKRKVLAQLPRELTSLTKELGLRNQPKWKTMPWANIQALLDGTELLKSGLRARWYLMVIGVLAAGGLGTMVFLGMLLARPTVPGTILGTGPKTIGPLTKATMVQEKVSMLPTED